MRYSLLLLVAVALAVPAAAQCTGTEGVDFTRVTLREVNALPQSSIDALNAGGADLDFDEDIVPNVTSPFNNEIVEFSAVFLTNPVLSSLGSPSGTGAPNRYHTFVRDTAADTDGVAGMGAQVVDGDGISTGAITDFRPGDEVTICGEVDFFDSASQINPISITLDDSRDSDDPILDPVVITTADIHDTYTVNGEDLSQVDWDVYSDFVNQYVRLESTELIQGIGGDRPNILLSTPGEEETLRSDNLSACFDNRRQDASYYPGGDVPDCVEDGEFVPPATGIVNVQGFLTLRSTFDAFDSTVPPGGAFSISPFEADDFEIAVAPPIVTVEGPAIGRPSGVPVSATIVPGTEGTTVATVTATYTSSSGASGSIELTNTSGDLYEGTITDVVAGDFVTYRVAATDSDNNASTPSAPVTRLVVDGAITEIFQVQRTEDGGPGSSSITSSDPIAFDLDAVVMTAGVINGRYQVTIQDDPNLGAFSGVLVDFGSASSTDNDPGLAVGDQINISQARVSEFNNVTQLSQLTFTETGSGEPYADKVVTTDLFNGDEGDEVGEQHEGILLRFEDVSITSTNPDAPAGPFGEFAFSSDGTEANAVRADDLSDAVPADFASTLTVGQDLDFIRGFLTFSFGNYKIIPPTTADVMLAVSVGNGPGESAVGIVGAYPNPSAGSVRIRFELATPGDASLRLYDLTGRQVATVAEGAFSADVHDVTADLDGLAAGVYVLRLAAGGDVATARIAVVR